MIVYNNVIVYNNIIVYNNTSGLHLRLGSIYPDTELAACR